MASNEFEQKLLRQRWYVKEDDLIGGWCVTNCDKTPSKMNAGLEEVVIGDFLSKRIAQEVVMGHQFIMDKYNSEVAGDQETV